MMAPDEVFQGDFIFHLPKELALKVLRYLQPKDLFRAAQTCHYWKSLVDDDLIWKEQCRRAEITTQTEKPRALSRCTSLWKATYLVDTRIESNWRRKPVDQAIVVPGHGNHIVTCMHFYGNRVLTGSDDTTLKVWSVVSGKCLSTLIGHTGGVWSSQMVGDLVISGSTDRTLRIWNIKDAHCLKVLTGHRSTVRCVKLHKNRIVSGSRDNTLRVWSVSGGRCLHVLIGHVAPVRCVQFDGETVVSGSYDHTVKVWNAVSGECLRTLTGHTNRIYSLQFDGVHIVSGSLDTSLRVWAVQSGQLKYVLTGHEAVTADMVLQGNTLVTGNADSTVKVWDMTTGRCIHTLSGANKHLLAVTSLHLIKRFVITASNDGTVKLWNLKTGEFIRNLVTLESAGVWSICVSATKLVCAIGSHTSAEETKIMILDFDVPGSIRHREE